MDFQDKYSEISYIITEELKKQGKEVIPLLKDGFDPKGKRDMVLRFEILFQLFVKKKMISINIVLKMVLRKLRKLQ